MDILCSAVLKAAVLSRGETKGSDKSIASFVFIVDIVHLFVDTTVYSGQHNAKTIPRLLPSAPFLLLTLVFCQGRLGVGRVQEYIFLLPLGVYTPSGSNLSEHSRIMQKTM